MAGRIVGGGVGGAILIHANLPGHSRSIGGNRRPIVPIRISVMGGNRAEKVKPTARSFQDLLLSSLLFRRQAMRLPAIPPTTPR